MGYDMSCVGDHPNGGDGDYFRLNIWGMGDYRQIMWDMKMVNEDRAPEYPKALADQVDDWDRYYDDPTSYPEYRQAAEGWTEYRGPSKGIPLEKFSSNDGWHVLPDEIGEALEAYEEYCNQGGALPFDDKERDAYFEEWIQFLRHTRDHGGFLVW